MTTHIVPQQFITDPKYLRFCLETSHGYAERCRAWLARAETENERKLAYEQLRSAEGEIERWQARLEACNA